MNARVRSILALVLAGLLAVPAVAAAAPVRRDSKLATRLSSLRVQVLRLEHDLFEGISSRKTVQSNMRKIRALLALQRRERTMGQARLIELQATVAELERRRKSLAEKITAERTSIHRFLEAIEKSSEAARTVRTSTVHLPEQERTEAPRRKVLANLVERGLKNIEAMKADVTDADQLERVIEEEKQQLVYLLQDLNEQASVLALNEQLQTDILKKDEGERLAQLQSYHKLKAAESEVENLIGNFNSRLELEHTVEAERQASRALRDGQGGGQSLFGALKGKLPLPILEGRIASVFGRAFDPKTQLYIFRKGITIESRPSVPVTAVSAGRVAYSGELPDYGRVAIIDHGDHFYTLCAHLGRLSRHGGDSVAAGDVIGSTDDSGTPVYFEIRSRNIPVNPLQWVAN